jgi:hypothetical protein
MKPTVRITYHTILVTIKAPNLLVSHVTITMKGLNMNIGFQLGMYIQCDWVNTSVACNLIKKQTAHTSQC